jgi:hypothetical protein
MALDLGIMLESIGVANPAMPDDKNPRPGYLQETTRQATSLGNTCQTQ